MGAPFVVLKIEKYLIFVEPFFIKIQLNMRNRFEKMKGGCITYGTRIVF
jgi:hypothetical protein